MINEILDQLYKLLSGKKDTVEVGPLTVAKVVEGEDYIFTFVQKGERLGELNLDKEKLDSELDKILKMLVKFKSLFMNFKI